MALDARTPIIREIQDLPTFDRVADQKPLRVLLAWAAPRDQNPLAVEREQIALALGFGFDDWRFSDRVMTYWTNFAKTGAPQDPGLPPWSPYGTLKQRDYFEFGRTLRPQSGLDVELYDLITQTWLVSAY